jgi:glycosyltransferase involved in cell wall biosynthesis
MPESLAVAHVALSLALGGLERVVLDLVRAGRELGQRVDVVCLEEPGLLAPQAEALGARVVCLHKRVGVRPGVFRQLRAALDDLRPDLVHTHQIGALFYTGPASRCPIAHTEHGKAGDDRLRRRWLGRFAGRFAARFFCVSRDIADEVQARRIVPRRKIHLVPNGIDAARFRDGQDPGDVRRALDISAGAPVIGTVGRLDEIKRQDLLIRAFGLVREVAGGSHLLLVGEGPARDGLQGLVDHLGLRNCVHFAGYQPQPERFLAAMDIFALTSRSEGMPLAVLEAWAAGLPVVATAVGGLPELIDDGRTGLLVPPDDEAALAHALLGLITAPAAARRMGGAGREQVDSTYSLHRMAETYHRHYLELLTRGSSDGGH